MLIGCVGNDYTGTYVFQMGKSKGTHLGASLELTKEVFDTTNPNRGNKFVFTIDISSSESSPDSMLSILNNINPLTGFYKIDTENKIYNENSLDIGITVLGEYELPQELTDLIFSANITSSAVTFYIPVSVNDLMYQLYWYGYDLNIQKIIEDYTSGTEPSESSVATPEGTHPRGTHPTQEDIDTINAHYPDEHNGNLYRDFHVLKLGLTKE